MLNWIKQKFAKGFWSTLAMVIVLLMAGPEIMVGMELMAMVELLGASTFVVAYLAGVRLWLSKGLNAVSKFESHSLFFIPSMNTLKEMPTMILHAVPERITVLSFLSMVTLAVIYSYSVMI